MRTVAPVIGVPDVGAAAAYMVDVLGFELVASFGGEPENPLYVIVRRGEVEIHLQGGWTPRAGKREPHETDAYVHVDDVDQLLEEFRGRGVVLHRDIVDNDYGQRDFCVRSPDGLRIAFGAPVVRMTTPQIE